ncbi:DUF4390 domain-containing protein [beta proteobacterium MWH-UniP1]
MMRLLPILLLWLATLMSPALANESESIRLNQPTLSLSLEKTWAIDANVQVTLSPVLIEAVSRGVPLYFVAEFEILKNRWYWFDEKVLTQTKVVRLSYHAVTQQYRVAVGGLHQMTYPELDQALMAATSMRGWQIGDPEGQTLVSVMQAVQAKPDAYELRLRVRLDSAQLPKPLQVNALTNRDWNLSSDWVRPKVVTKSMSELSGALQ